MNVFTATARLLIAASLLAVPPRQARQAAPPRTDGATTAETTEWIRQAYAAAYNLDYDDAMALGRRAVALRPDESRTHRTLASMLWLQILFNRGAFFVDHYLGGATKSAMSLPKPPAALDAEFKLELGKAIALAEAKLDKNSRDLESRYDQGAAYAIQASYLASVEGSVFAAFRSAKHANDAEEEVLEKQPARADATMTVGTYKYIISVMSLPERMLAFLAGFSSDKDEGIKMLETAARDPGSHVDAKVALLLIYSREGRHNDAERVARELSTEFPRNRVFLFEVGSAAIRAGRAAEAEAVLTSGIAAYEKDKRAKIPGELALWLYKRGMARVMQARVADAQADLSMAQRNAPAEWVSGRIHLELGKVADLGGRRADAITEYQIALATATKTNDPVCADSATALIKRPYVR